MIAVVFVVLAVTIGVFQKTSVAPINNADGVEAVAPPSYSLLPNGEVDLSSLLKNDTFPVNFTLNDQGVEFAKKMMVGEHDSSALQQMKVNLALQYLYAGAQDSCIDILASLVPANPDLDNPDTRKQLVGLYSMLGLAWQRMGEVTNCRAGHNSNSCILPFQADAVHSNKQGSTNAIEYYKKALELDTTQDQDRWLLNICYMTLGQYPKGVPKQYLIDLNQYDEKTGLKRLVDVAPQLGVNSMGLLGGNDIEDFNNDGNLDLFSTSFNLRDNVHLYINDGKGGFVDETEKAGLLGIVGGANTVHADYNNDGNTDILIVRGGWMMQAGQQPLTLLKNNGDGTFSDVTVHAGLLGFHPSHTACWADVNNDGWLDLFVGNERWDSSSTQQASQLFINQKDGTFKEQALQAGIDLDAYVKGAVFGDINNDGLPDLYVSVYGSGNLLYLNEGVNGNGQVHFAEMGQKAGVQQPAFSFPCAMFDINNDGWEDILVMGYSIDPDGVDLPAEYMGKSTAKNPSKVYINNHNNTFTDASEAYGLNKRSVYAMAMNYGDLDNDGFLDFYAATGNADLRSVWPNVMFKNIEGKRFADVTTETGTGHLQKGHAVAFGDVDNNGTQDVFLDAGGFLTDDRFGNLLFQNPNNDNHWLGLKLTGSKANRSAIGARIKVVFKNPAGDTVSIYRTVSTGGSYGASSLQQVVGVGKADMVLELSVTWPGSGLVQHFSNVTVGQYYGLVEGKAALEPLHKTPIRFNTAMPAMHMNMMHH